MQPAIVQQPRAVIIVQLIMGVIFGFSAYGLVRQLPNGDLGAVFNSDLMEQALNNRQAHLLTLTLAAFGLGLGGNHLLTGLGRTLNVSALGKVIMALIGLIVIGGLVVGVVTNALTGISVPVVMNTGIGLWVGSGLGWWSASAQPRPSFTAWGIGVTAALLTFIALSLLT